MRPFLFIALFLLHLLLLGAESKLIGIALT